MASMYLCRDSNKMGEAITSIESRNLTIRVVFDVFESDREFIKVCGSLEENESVSSKLNMSEPQVKPWGWEGVGGGFGEQIEWSQSILPSEKRHIFVF